MANFPQIIDNSMRATFVACPEKFRRSFISNLAPNKPSVHLHAGGCFAAALDVTRQAFYSAGLSEQESLCLGVTELIKRWGGPDADGLLPFWDEDKNLGRMLWAFDDYFREYRLSSDPIKPLIANGRATTEFSFSIPMELNHPDTGEPLLFAGRFDMIGSFQNSLFVVDEKTTSALGNSWGQQWELKSQFTGYCAAARLYGYPVVGSIIRGVGLLKNSTTFQQVILYRPTWQIERWWDQLHRDIQRAIDLYREFGSDTPWDQALDEACAQYGGCAFRRLCLSQEPERWIDGYFVERIWNPLDKH
jgi:hypothetical protein